MTKTRDVNAEKGVAVLARTIEFLVRGDHVTDYTTNFEIQGANRSEDSIKPNVVIHLGAVQSANEAIARLHLAADHIREHGLPSATIEMSAKNATRLLKAQQNAADATHLLSQVPPRLRKLFLQGLDNGPATSADSKAARQKRKQGKVPSETGGDHE